MDAKREAGVDGQNSDGMKDWSATKAKGFGSQGEAFIVIDHGKSEK